MTFQRGDVVRLTFDGQTLDAFVALASADRAAVLLFFDGFLSGYVGGMPVVLRDGAYVDLFHSRPVRLDPIPTH